MKTPTAPLKPKTILIPVDNSSQAEEAVRRVQPLTLPERVLPLHIISIPQLAYPGTGMSVGHNFSGVAEKALREEGARILEKAPSLLPRGRVSCDHSPRPLFRALDSGNTFTSSGLITRTASLYDGLL